MLRKILLLCGIFSSLLYVAMNIYFPPLFEGYSYASQTVSELSAVGAPTRAAWLPLGILYTVLFIAFGFGVKMSANQNRKLSIAGSLVIIYGIIGIAWPFAPMHLRGAEFTLTDAMHIALGSVTVLLMLLIMFFGALAFGNRFRLYTIASILVYLIFGILTGIASPRIAENLPTPWLGVWERIIIGDFLLWVIVLAIILCNNTRMMISRQE